MLDVFGLLRLFPSISQSLQRTQRELEDCCRNKDAELAAFKLHAQVTRVSTARTLGSSVFIRAFVLLRRTLVICTENMRVYRGRLQSGLRRRLPGFRPLRSRSSNEFRLWKRTLHCALLSRPRMVQHATNSGEPLGVKTKCVSRYPLSSHLASRLLSFENSRCMLAHQTRPHNLEK